VSELWYNSLFQSLLSFCLAIMYFTIGHFSSGATQVIHDALAVIFVWLCGAEFGKWLFTR
jgi:hypothetical protein